MLLLVARGQRQSVYRTRENAARLAVKFDRDWQIACRIAGIVQAPSLESDMDLSLFLFEREREREDGSVSYRRVNLNYKFVKIVLSLPRDSATYARVGHTRRMKNNGHRKGDKGKSKGTRRAISELTRAC